ncbi:F0F1 ATP synthase subunit delta [Vibrio fluvialis]|uniref:F0F1 ATP synthase subunit delta n=1 Tax=Vibrio fluvialis TaxID=676 RepID=UPI001F19E595|nr:F0F1 ATP synthase subunit delta [Vibrio fluvialis]MCE7600980.1 F0F1 ATP synthase subunit delta [Vibrio fluvialis]
MSDLTVVAQPYAKAAFDFAKEIDALDEWQQTLTIAEMILTQPNTVLMLNELDEESSEQPLLEMMLQVGGEFMNQYFQNFLKVMAENRRLKALSEVLSQFREYMAEFQQTMNVTVCTSEPLDDEQALQLTQALTQRFGKTITLEQQLDPSLVGGVVIKAGQTVFDGSVIANIGRLSTNLHV